MALLEVAATPSPQASLGQWKHRLARQREELRERFSSQESPRELLRRQSAMVDRQLKEVWASHALPRTVALAAVGGYGRGQLFPCSDVDLLILLSTAADARLARKIEDLIGMLWDIGIEVGHSVRTVDECQALAATDITVQTTLMEARLLAGKRDLYARFVKRMRDALDPAQFMRAKLLEQQQRHVRYAETNLEPNIKESAGGLRDLQAILWIARAAGVGHSWRQLAGRGVITEAEAREINQHEQFLQSLRIRLHYCANRREDRLLFDYQTALARQFDLHDRHHRLASEQLMQRYYRTAKAVSQINTIVLQNLDARIVPPRHQEYRAVNERFGIRGELLVPRDERLFQRQPSAILESFLLLQQRPGLKGMSATALRALWRARRLINAAFRKNPGNRELFLRLLRSSDRVARTLRLMNQYDVLGRYLPVFGRIVGQMQHDLYHVYTVDEHILRVLRNVRRFSVTELSHEFPLCSRLIGDFARTEVLYLAALFHDIGKGRGGDHSQLGAVDARRFCQEHGLASEDVELISWLVVNHLVMSATAQKQDISDPEVVRAFAGRVGDERHLIALYLLTVADIRGTSPKVWNAWKAKLLEDLFWATRKLLAGDSLTLAGSLQSRQEEARTRLRLYAVPDDAERKLWSQVDDTYFLRHEPQEIAWHTRTLYYRVTTDRPVVKVRLSPAGEGLQVMIFVPDQKGLFARICSFFERLSYSIYEAKIYTTRHGYALDSFQVQDPDNRRPQYRDVIGLIEHDLAEQFLHKAPLPPLSKPRLARQLRHFPMTPEVNIQPDEKGTAWVLSLSAGDRPGLLSRIARVLTAYDINLHTAKVNTLGGRAEDVFIISGEALKDSKTVVRLESDLLEQLRT